jgi:polysaccharide export outer membrane protein
VELKDDTTRSESRFASSIGREVPRGASSLAFASAKPDTITATPQEPAEACEVRFVPVPSQRADSRPAAPPQVAAPQPVLTGSELFATPPITRPSAFKPRIVTVLEHIPAPVPRHIAATPVRAAHEVPPTFAPVGSELFSSATAAPKKLDPPALDYGTALRQAQPPQTTMVATKPIESARTVAQELPPAAAELFTFAPSQPEVPKPQIVAKPKIAALTFVESHRVVLPPKPVAAPVVARVTSPVAAPTAVERLVPATVARPSASKSPFAYESGNVAAESHATIVVPAVAPSLAPPPARSQVAVTEEPNEPNVYTFRFAAMTHDMPTTLVSRTEPIAEPTAGDEPAAVLPDAIHFGECGCPYLPGQSGTRSLCGIDCGQCGAPCCSTWSDAQCIPWSLFGPGEYVGPARPAHIETYYLRVNDFLTLTFIESRKKSAEHYRIGVGDQLQIEWLQGAGNAETRLDRKLLVQPDGTVTLPLIGEVTAAGKTINDFRDEVVASYSKYQREPQITVTPLTVNVAVQDVLKAVTSKSASSGQTQDVRVTPEGTIQAAGIGSVYVQGLTLDELRSELEARYAEAYGPGLAVSPQLTERATSYVFMGGEVRAPGRYTLEGPTTVMQAISMAGGWNNGGNVRQVVVFRRDENWCLKATKIDVRAPLYGNDPCPTNDVWLRENDLVLVPKTKILCATDLIELYFTRGVYAVFPINYVYDFSQNSGITPVPF